MPIIIDETRKLFHLRAGGASYILTVWPSGHLTHVHWGAPVSALHMGDVVQATSRAFSPTPDPADKSYSLDTLPLEYPAYGNSDFRAPAYQVQLENGTDVTDLRYESHRVLPGKPALPGLPATYVEDAAEADTLEITLRDELTGLQAILLYTAYADRPIVTRSVRLVNAGKKSLKVLRALSMSVDLPRADYELLHLSGAWARERHVVRRPLTPGTHSIESRRGASSHQQNPFLALLDPGATETAGEVRAVNLVYSGNFLAQAEVDQFATTRLSIGINPFDFSWLMKPGESFQTPEAVLAYSAEGLGGLSRALHSLYRSRLCRGRFRDGGRPILINNWEATYFGFTPKKILELAKAAKKCGIELLVLDDGWFGHRDNDSTSLGDWLVYKNKLPDGLKALAEGVNREGLQFGLWFEPEMVSPDSDLYRAHPDWCLHVPDRARSEGRNQLVLDLTRREVRDAVVQMVSDVLKSAPISYVKWDMNRHMTEVGSAALPPERQRETAHRYMLGVYEMMERITAAFPDVLFESCSGGGGRFDPGLLYYMPQAWASDDTDAIERLHIQWGTSIAYPASTMGSHVSAVPNHQVGRLTPIETRGAVAMSGNLGYELDLTVLPPEDLTAIAGQVAFYKRIRGLVHTGDFYRLQSPEGNKPCAWMFVSEDKKRAFVVWVQPSAVPHGPLQRLRLAGLGKALLYQSSDGAITAAGDELMALGLAVPELHGDYRAVTWLLEAK